MVKNINKFWVKQGETIMTGVFAVVMAFAVVTVRYMNYFL